MPKLASGQRLSARYIVRERLSEGALGETWRAVDEQRNREVVVKVLRAGLAGEPAALERLRAEVEAAQRLSHPGLASGYSLETASPDSGAAPFLVRDYIEGRDLSSLRAQPWRLVLPAAVDVAEAVAALHAAGLVHRDLKSSNAIVAADGSVKVIDLGSAAAIGDASVTGSASPYSQSPQQLSGEPPQAADDIYAFGALLYELLGGYPPFYPNFSAERVLSEAPAPLRPVHKAPGALLDLVMSLLEKDPSQRPQSLAGIATQLRELLAQPDEPAGDAVTAPAAAREAPASIIRPIVRPLDRAPAVQVSGEGRRRAWIVGSVIAVLVAIAVAVFVALPEYSVKPTLAPPPTATAADPNRPSEPQEIDYEAMAVEMDRAEQAQGAYDAMFKSLADRGAAQWAAQPFAAAKALGEQARVQFEERKFVAARETYKSGLDKLQEVTDESKKVLERELARGAAALQVGQSAVAIEAFALAKRIDPQNAAAARGAGRASTLDRVIALMTAASNDERESRWAEAEQKYRQALELDRDTRSAAEGLARVQTRIANDAYAAAMSAGFGHLNAGRLGEARTAFGRAGQIRPGAREVNDALAQVSQAGEKRSIEGHRSAAEGHERAERWEQALAEYQAALKIDPALQFAQAGVQRVTPRLELARGLEVHIQKPERLTSSAVRAQAYQQLGQAEQIASPGPELTRQMAQVRAHLKKVEAPVRVALESDNATVVVIHKVGPLGAFERREIDLLPGKYTVVGSRMGYRDVRRELEVQPGDPPPPLLIRCEERI